jgi:hypothetical protein
MHSSVSHAASNAFPALPQPGYNRAMGRIRVILEDSVTISLPGWDFDVPLWAVGLLGILFLATIAAVAIQVPVRMANRANSPPDLP